MAAITEGLSRLKVRFNPLAKLNGIYKKWCGYFGSVRFFKHMILAALAILITVPWIFVAFLAVRYSEAKSTAAYTEQLLDEKLMSISNEELNDSVSFIYDDIQAEVPYYQELYPDFYAPQELNLTSYSDNTIYLTFDDGPSPRTPEVLSILTEKNVKATFFVVGQSDEESYQWMRDIVEQGHTLGMHSYTHQYNVIYESVESYLDDMYKMFVQIKEVTGTAPTVFRFAGGSVNAYNTGINQEIIAEMMRRGFVPYDWNISSEDAATNPPAAQVIVNNVVSQSKKVNRGVVLMHDSDYKYTTVAALPDMIDSLRAEGFEFAAIQPDTQPVLFAYRN